jgi:hypothetical protein
LRPLFFLTFRCLVNGLKRSLTSPKRLITTLVIVSYYFYWFARPLMTSSVGFRRTGMLTAQYDFPPLELLDAIVFSAFAGLSLILALGIFGYRSSFKPADVDVLFPTPVNPRIVLMFRIVRDYLATLLVPLFAILVTWKPLHLEEQFRNVPHPQSSAYALRALSLGFLLITTAWVGMGYALSLYVNRNDSGSELRKKVIGWAIAVPSLIVVALTVRAALAFESVADFVGYVQQPWLKAFFFTATFASKIVMGPLEGNSMELLFGAASLLAISGASLYVALKQADWMYDQAAVRGFGAESLRQLQRKGDFMGVMAEAARSGKLRVRKSGWFQQLRMKGFGALIWKDALVQWRSIRGMILVFLVTGMLVIVMPRLTGMRTARHESVGYLVLMMEGFIAFMVATMTSQSGFTELLRRTDLQKPLPFTPHVIVLSEVVAKALPAIIIPVFCSLASLALFPFAWREVFAGMIFFPSLGAVICSLVCVIVLLFPEIDDVSQRGFRGLMMLLGLLFVGAPGVIAFGLLTYATKSPIIGSVPGAVLNLAVAFGLTTAGGSLYASFNPSE